MVGGGGLSDPGPRFADPVEPPPEGTPWTVLRLLRWSTGYLSEKGVPDSRLDVEYLLAETLGTDRLQLYLQFERPVETRELEQFRPLLLERARRRPLQYILGRAFFRDLELTVDPRALIPRPETEELVGAALERMEALGREGLQALDVCTGSGAIALALAQEGPFGRVVATDVSHDALELARRNAEAADLDNRIELREGAGFEPIREGERFDLVISNPPYVTSEEFTGLEPEVREWEPREALVAGEDGMDVIRELVSGAGARLVPGGLLAMEFGAGQAEEVVRLVREVDGFDRPEIRKDLARRDRMVLVTWRGEAQERAEAATRPRERTETHEREAAGETHGDTARIPTKVQGDVQD